MANHLLIGLGGTGGKTLKAFREQIIDRENKLETEDVKKHIRFIWIDSNKQEMEERWVRSGLDFTLRSEEKLTTQGGSVADVVNKSPIPVQYQGWIGEPDDWGYITSKAGKHSAGGQVRRLGRFNFSQYVSRFVDKVDAAINVLQRDVANGDVSVHIIAGLAGGSGSGGIIDVAAQITNRYKDVKLYFYVVTPEKVPPKGHLGEFEDVTFYHANGYAALKELNAYSTTLFTPFDLSNMGNNPKKIDPELRTNGTFIFSEKSEEGKHLFSGDNVVKKLASFLHLRTLTVETDETEGKKDANNSDELREALHRMATMENKFYDPENVWGLSNLFHSVGTQSLVVPKQRIKSFISYEIIANTLSKIIHNNFEANTGFLPQEKDLDEVGKQITEIIEYRNYSVLDEWHLSPDYIMLMKFMQGEPIGDWSQKNESAEDEINRIVQGSFSNLERSCYYAGTKFVPKELFKFVKVAVSKYMTEQFRTNGLAMFFNARMREENVKKYAQFISSNVKDKVMKELSSNSVNNNFSLDSAINFLFDVRTKYGNTHFTKILSEQQDNYRKRIKKLEEEIIILGKNYLDTFGGLIPKTKKREQLKPFFQKALSEYWQKKTTLQGIDFAIAIRPILFDQELKDLEDEFRKMRENLIEMRDTYCKKVEDAQKRFSNTDADARLESFDCSNDKSLNTFLSKLKSSKDNYDRLINSVGNEVLNCTELLVSNNTDEVIASIEKIAFDSSNEILSAERLKELIPEGDDFFDANIIDLLCSKYKNIVSTDLKEIFSSMREFSSPMVELKQGINNNIEIEKFAIVPVYDKTNQVVKGGGEFYDAIVSYLKESDFKVLKSKHKSEITFIQTLKGVRLDNLERVDYLHKEYSQIISERNVHGAKFLLHTQSDFETVNLIIPSLKEFNEMTFPYLWMLELVDGFDKKDNGNYAILELDNRGIKTKLPMIDDLGFCQVDDFPRKEIGEKLNFSNNFKTIVIRAKDKIDTDKHRDMMLDATAKKIKEKEGRLKEYYELSYLFIQEFHNEPKNDEGII